MFLYVFVQIKQFGVFHKFVLFSLAVSQPKGARFPFWLRLGSPVTKQVRFDPWGGVAVPVNTHGSDRQEETV